MAYFSAKQSIKSPPFRPNSCQRIFFFQYFILFFPSRRSSVPSVHYIFGVLLITWMLYSAKHSLPSWLSSLFLCFSSMARCPPTWMRSTSCVCVWGPLRLRTPPYMGFSMRKTIRIMCWERSHYQRLALIVSVVVKVDLHPSDINTEFLYVRSTMNFWSAAASLYQSIGRFVHFSFSWGI